MTNLKNHLKNLFSPIKPISPKMIHFISPQDDPRNYRLHLRIETDGSGILIVNGSTILHLNQTATEYANYLVLNIPIEKASREMASRYQVDPSVAKEDYQLLIDRIQSLINTPDLDPVTFLDFDRHHPFTGPISAPYRLDCAITYKIPENSNPDITPHNRAQNELTTAEWFSVLDKAWSAAIPHIVFTGGEPTLRGDLPELIGHAETNGQITGLLTDGHRLTDKEYLHTLLATGLDHLMIIVHPELESDIQAIQNCLEEDIFLCIHLTLTPENREALENFIKTLVEQGVKAVSLSSNSPDLKDDLLDLRKLVADLNVELVWNLPVPYSSLHPVWMELASPPPEVAGRAWIYVEPDGDVLAAQGSDKKMGNFLRDSWDTIWK